MEQAAEGIEFLNSRGIFHRDIKPQNLFLVGGQVKVGDLGFLKLAGLSTVSQTGVGTVGYLPLEAYPRSANEKGQLHRTIDCVRTGGDVCASADGQATVWHDPARDHCSSATR